MYVCGERDRRLRCGGILCGGRSTRSILGVLVGVCVGGGAVILGVVRCVLDNIR